MPTIQYILTRLETREEMNPNLVHKILMILTTLPSPLLQLNKSVKPC